MFWQVHTTGVPITNPPHQDQQVKAVLDWPAIGETAIDEFNTPGYIVQAFPTLFPTGKADLHNPRNHTVSALDFFR